MSQQKQCERCTHFRIEPFTDPQMIEADGRIKWYDCKILAHTSTDERCNRFYEAGWSTLIENLYPRGKGSI